MKVATFNANSIRARLDAVAAWLRAHAPDILAIQETKAADDAFPALALAEEGYHVLFSGQKSYNGVALLARAAPRDVQYGFDDGEEPADPSRLLAAQVGGIRIVNTYVPQGRELDHPMYAYKLAWLARLRRFFERRYRPTQRVLWLGDLNVCPAAIDIYNAEKQTQHVAYHESARAALRDTVAWGFEDVFRRHHPEPGHYTYFDYRLRDAVAQNKGWRVDHIFATPPLARTSTAAWIDLEPRRAPSASDHTFLVAEFDV